LSAGPATTITALCAAGATAPRTSIARPGQPCLSPAGDLGFEVDEAEMVFWGVRPTCQAAEGSPDGAERDEEERQ
jgi:Fur family ferric uptake transcriptional regulator